MKETFSETFSFNYLGWVTTQKRMHNNISIRFDMIIAILEGKSWKIQDSTRLEH